mmetsp:Transcript_6704/g.9772  ORF Transcript_6704/g.9772 Transcript_6704/m.9772 type:complete len:87 (+) Transcript_6704:267-527(+)
MKQCYYSCSNCSPLLIAHRSLLIAHCSLLIANHKSASTAYLSQIVYQVKSLTLIPLSCYTILHGVFVEKQQLSTVGFAAVKCILVY